jgi:hypothetical protein
MKFIMENWRQGVVGKVKIYRAQPATTTEIRTGDFITMSRKFAGEHAVTSAIYNGEDFYVVYAFVDEGDIEEASNPGEFKYTGEPFDAKASQIASYDEERADAPLRSALR